MTRFGTEIDTDIVDELGSTVSIISTVHNYEIRKKLKRYCIRVRVEDKQQEMVEFLTFTDLIEQKRKEGTLFINDKDPASQPMFIIEYPDKLGPWYSIIRSYTEIVV